MKKIFTLMILAALALVSCETPTGPVPPQPEAPVLSTTADLVEVAAIGGSAQIAYAVENPVDGVTVEATSTEAWLSDWDYSAEGVVAFVVEENTATEPREAVVTLAYAGAENVTVTVKQAAAEPAQPEPDYTLTSAEVAEGYLDNYGDMYGVGLSDFNLEVYGMVIDEAAGTATIKALFMEFLSELSNTTGEGTYTAQEIDWMTGEGLTANTYLKAQDFDGQIAGCGYIEMDGFTEEILAYEGIASGTLTVSKSDEVYTVKGVFTTLSGKILEVDCTSEAIVYGDYSQNGGVAPLSVKNSTAKLNKTFSSAMKFMKK